jgi:hypothetical protein
MKTPHSQVLSQFLDLRPTTPKIFQRVCSAILETMKIVLALPALDIG